mmetsp:Transcript_4692/g.11858  ORF Transcript_4692/g.11858 Transcript_4692/m.11858 type:complete len:200 (-) Transcript_4692:495-1094(-)
MYSARRHLLRAKTRRCGRVSLDSTVSSKLRALAFLAESKRFDSLPRSEKRLFEATAATSASVGFFLSALSYPSRAVSVCPIRWCTYALCTWNTILPSSISSAESSSILAVSRKSHSASSSAFIAAPQSPLSIIAHARLYAMSDVSSTICAVVLMTFSAIDGSPAATSAAVRFAASSAGSVSASSRSLYTSALSVYLPSL